MNKINYQKELDKVIEVLQRQGRVPRLLLHSCCAPCSSYVLEYLSRYFEITVFYYNPNIYPPEEFGKRVEEQKRLIAQLPAEHPISFLDGPYEPERFYEMARGLEQIPEGGRAALSVTVCVFRRLRRWPAPENTITLPRRCPSVP